MCVNAVCVFVYGMHTRENAYTMECIHYVDASTFMCVNALCVGGVTVYRVLTYQNLCLHV